MNRLQSHPELELWHSGKMVWMRMRTTLFLHLKRHRSTIPNVEVIDTTPQPDAVKKTLSQSAFFSSISGGIQLTKQPLRSSSATLPLTSTHIVSPTESSTASAVSTAGSEEVSSEISSGVSLVHPLY